jgi:hypothetical protein
MKKRIAATLSAVLILLLWIPVSAGAMLDKNAEPPVVVSSGSFDSTYQTSMDFSISGGTLTSAQWTRNPMYVSYTVTGTCKEGATVSLSVTGHQTPTLENNASAQLVFNQLTMKATQLDSDGKTVGEEDRYTSGTVNTETASHAMSCTAESGVKTVAITGVFVCRWAGASVAEETVAVTVQLDVEDAAPAIAAPVELETPSVVQQTPADVPPSEPQPGTQEPAAAVQEPAIVPDMSQPDTTTQEPAAAAQDLGTAEAEPSAPPETFLPDAASADAAKLPDADSTYRPWAHAGPLATAVISVLAALAAALGGAAGGVESAAGGRWDPRKGVRDEAKTMTDYFAALWGSYGQKAYDAASDGIHRILDRPPSKLLNTSYTIREGSQSVRKAALDTMQQIEKETRVIKGWGNAVSKGFTYGGMLIDALDQMKDRNREDGTLITGDSLPKAAAKSYVSNTVLGKVLAENPALVLTDVLMTVGAAGTKGGSAFAPSNIIKGVIHAGIDLTDGGIATLSPGETSDRVAERAKAGFYGDYLGNIAQASAQVGEMADDLTLGEASDILTDYDYYESMRKSADKMWSDEKGKMGYTGKVASGIMKGVITTGELVTTGTKAASEMVGTVFENSMLKLRKFFA